MIQKRFIALLLSIAILGSLSFIQSDMNSTVSAINQALKTGNTSKFLSFLADPVDLTLPNTDDSYSKAQAAIILKKFFASNKVKSYVQKQSGKSVDNSVFIIGTYTATNGKKFRSYVLIKAVGSKNLIQFVEFEEE
jgi:hypothetical protein